MMKKLLLIFSLFSINSYAEVIKLSCEMIAKKSYPDSSVENSVGLALVEVNRYPTYVTISIASENDSLNDISVVNNYPSNKYKTYDFSDALKWDIRTTNSKFSNQIIIDRNTGKIIVHKSFYPSSGGTLQTDASGDCKKINTTQKKF